MHRTWSVRRACITRHIAQSGDTPEDDARKRGHYALARLIRDHGGAAGGGAEEKKALEQRVAQLERALREKNDALSRS